MWEWCLPILFVVLVLYVYSQIRKEPMCSQCTGKGKEH